MQVTALEILGSGGESCPNLGLERATRDALKRYADLRFGHMKSRRKAVADEWSLSQDEARAVLEATASAATIDRIFKHRNGGWQVALPVLGAVIGQSFDQFIASEARRRANAGERYLADSRHLLQVARDLPFTLSAVGAAGDPELDAGRPRPRRAVGGRQGHEPD